MKTEITYKYENERHCVRLNCATPANAGGRLLQLFPKLDGMKVKIINCVGIVPRILPDEVKDIIHKAKRKK